LANLGWLGWLGLISIAASLRLTGLDFGLPHALHPDEPGVVKPALVWLRSSEWSFGMWKYPPTMAELTGWLSWLAQEFGVCGGEKCRPDQLLYGARLVSALAGVAAVACVSVAARVAGLVPWQCWLAGMLLAVSPLHVQSSRYAKPDILATLAICVALIGVAGMWSSRQTGSNTAENGPSPKFRRWLTLAAIASGSAAACKYNAGLVVLAPLVVLVTSGRTGRTQIIDFLWCTAVCLLSFLAPLLAVGSGLDPLFQGLHHEWTHYRSEGHGGYDTATAGRDALRQLAFVAWGMVPTLVALVGIAAAWKHRATHRARLALGLGLSGLAIAFLVAIQTVFFARVLLPLLPLLALWTVLVLDWIWPKTRQKPWLVAMVCGLFLAQPTWMAVTQTTSVATIDTRIQAGKWLAQNLPKTRRLALVPGGYQAPIGIDRRRDQSVPHPTLKRLRVRGYTHAVISSSGYTRYLNHPRRFPDQVAETTAWRAELTSQATLVGRFEAPAIPGMRVFGSTFELYHSPTIEVYALRPTASRSEPAP